MSSITAPPTISGAELPDQEPVEEKRLTKSASTRTETNRSDAPETDLRPGSLRPEDLEDRLRLNNTDLVKEVYDLAQKHVVSETARQQRLDTKATNLLAASGVSISAAVAIGGQVLVKGHSELRIGLDAWQALMFFFVLAVGLALFAAASAVWALRVTGESRALNDQDVFNTAKLEEADADEAGGVAFYQRWMTIQLWGIGEAAIRSNTRKSKTIRYGQFSFLGFMGSLFLVLVIFLCARSWVVVGFAAADPDRFFPPHSCEI